MTGISLHMQWPLTSQSHGKENNWFFVTDQSPYPNFGNIFQTLWSAGKFDELILLQKTSVDLAQPNLATAALAIT
jgi:hypothetical protein